MHPRLVTPPATELVPVADLRDYLELQSDYRDTTIMALQAAVLADLQQQTGRCILEQTWEIDLPGAGTWPLPFPDVTSVTAEVGYPTLGWSGHRQTVTVTEATTVQFTAAMTEPLLSIARVVVRQTVAWWFSQREAASDRVHAPVPMGTGDLITRLRWSML